MLARYERPCEAQWVEEQEKPRRLRNVGCRFAIILKTQETPGRVMSRLVIDAIAPSDVEHTFVILARGPDLEWAFIRLSRNAIRFSTPPSRWDETLLSFQPRTLNGSRLLAAVFFPWRMLTWGSRVFEIAF
jgi:hypothetical protein